MLALSGRLIHMPYTLLATLGGSQSLLAMRRTLSSSDQQAVNICAMGQLEMAGHVQSAWGYATAASL